MLLLILLHLHLITLPSMFAFHPALSKFLRMDQLVGGCCASWEDGRRRPPICRPATVKSRRRRHWVQFSVRHSISCVCVFALPPTERSHRLSSHRIHPPLRPPRSGRRRGGENGLGGVGAGIREGGRDPNHRRVRPL